MTPLGNFEESENKSHVLLCVRSFIILSESTAANTLENNTCGHESDNAIAMANIVCAN